MKKILLVALDLDRTTLDKAGGLSDHNRRALLDAMSRGVTVCIASGRCFDSLPACMTGVPGIQYAITGNGACLYRLTDGKRLKAFLISETATRDILRVAEGFESQVPLAYEAFIDGKAYAGSDYFEDPVRFGATKAAIPYIRSTRRPVPDIRHFILEHAGQLDGLDIVTDSEEKKKEIEAAIHARTSEVYTTSSVHQLLEISDCHSGKGRALQALARMLSIPRENTAAFGDADNDVPMLSWAGTGVAVANASPAALAAANFITKRHDEDGVAWGLEKLIGK
jgi:Cof subfamily protein (haloacid dehalogenase superfamily)